MFYYYEKAGKLLASERRDLPYLKAEPAPGTPICYLVEGDPVLGRGSFKVTHPGQLANPNGLEVLDASRLPDFPLDAPLSAALEDLQRGLGSLQHVQVGHHVLAAELAGIVRVRLPGSGDGRLALQRNRADSGDPFYHRQGGLRIEEGVVGIRRGCNQGFLRIRQVLICRPGGYNGILAPGADFFPNRFHQIVKRLYCGHVVRRYAPAQGLHRLVETGDLRCLQIKLAADTQCLVSRFCSFNF